MVPISSRNSVPPVGHFEQALLAGDGVGERALDVAEERGLQQIGGHRTGVHGNERAILARRVHVNGFRDQFLAGAALALHQHRRASGSDLRHQVEDAQHRIALADNVLEVVALLERALELDDLFFGATASDRAAHIGQQLLVVPGLLDEIIGPGLHGIDRVLHRAVGGDHDHRPVRNRARGCPAGFQFRCAPAAQSRAAPGRTASRRSAPALRRPSPAVSTS